jgi:hypothetical protein
MQRVQQWIRHVLLSHVDLYLGRVGIR